MQELNSLQIQQVNGHHTTGISVLFLLELPHIFMGLREFINYSVTLWQNGCQTRDEDDHFTQFFSGLIYGKSH